MPRVIGGRYGLASKEFTPAMVKARLRRARQAERRSNHFTVGIVDDVTHLSLDYDPAFTTEPDDVVRAVFYGLGADGTVGANKNSVKIIGEETDLLRPGLLRLRLEEVRLDDRLAPALRAATDPLDLPDRRGPTSWPATSSSFLERIDVLDVAEPGATFLLNSPYGPDEVWDHLPVEVQQQIVDKGSASSSIDAYRSRARRAWAAASTR